MKLNNSETVLQRIRQGDESIIEELYAHYRDPFIHWLVNQYQCQIIDAKEIFQISIVTFYENVITGKLTRLTSSLNTYLFSIGRNKMREWKRQNNKEQPFADLALFSHVEEWNDLEEKQAKEAIFLEIEKALNQLGETCKSLLMKVYFYRISMKEISKGSNYKNENSAKNAKYKCLQRLKKMMNP